MNITKIKDLFQKSITVVLTVLLASAGVALATVTITNNSVTSDSSYAIDTTAANPGPFSIGTSSATLINIGRTGILTTVSGPLTVSGTSTLTGLLTANGGATITGGTISLASSSFANGGVGAILIDSAGVISVGTTSATAINIGKTGILTTVSGPLTVSGTSTLTGLLTANGGATITGGAISLASSSFANGGSGPITIDSTGIISVGTSSATGVNIGSLTATTGVKGILTVTGTSTFSGHVISSGTIPIVGGNCTTPAVTTGSTDTRGALSAASCTAGQTVSLTFASAYASSPFCVISASSTATAVASSSISATSSAMTVSIGVAVTAPGWNYICMQ